MAKPRFKRVLPRARRPAVEPSDGLASRAMPWATVVSVFAAAIASIASLIGLGLTLQQLGLARSAPREQAIAVRQVEACGEIVQAALTLELRTHLFLTSYGNRPGARPPRAERRALRESGEALTLAVATREIFFSRAQREALAKMKKALLDAEVLAQAQPVKIENMPANYFERYMDGQVMATIYDVKTMCRNQIAPGVP